MFSYQLVALSGSAAYAATWERGRSISIAVSSAPRRLVRGAGVVALDVDASALNPLTPHPVYAWTR